MIRILLAGILLLLEVRLTAQQEITVESILPGQVKEVTEDYFFKALNL